MIDKRVIAVPLFAASLWAAGTPQDAKTVIASATTALGAGSLKTIEYSGRSEERRVGKEC